MARILIVDDESEIRHIARVMLEKHGYEVFEAKSGAECLKMLTGEKPGLILLDIMMPGEDGWEILKKIKAANETKDIPIAMFTVKSGKEHIKKSMELGADAHINKPFESKELLDTVKKLIRKAS